MKTFEKTLFFYINGFKNMKVGKTLWKIIFIKLAVILIFLKIFIYDKSIKSEYITEDQKSQYVFDNLSQYKNQNKE